jgi:nitrite reductase/ring-hydroxylating ferredoxin subunit
VALNSKISFFLIAIVLTISLSSCNKKNDVIPDVTIDFRIDINDPEFTNLASFGGIALVNSETNNLGIYAAGYDGNGIIIFSGVDEYYAYDRTCPHDYATGVLSIKVNIDPTNSLNAICPKCNTNYALAAGGTPSKGVGRYPLKNYKTSFESGRYVHVWN